MSDSHKSLAKRLKKLVKTWQQLIQSQTPNGLTAPSLCDTGNGGGGASKTEQRLHQQPNIVESRCQSVSSSREGTPSQLSSGEPLAGKSGGPPSHKNASRTPTPTPSPHPPSSVQPTSLTQCSPAPVSAPPSQPPVIPRPTKAQDFARNRIRYMQMFSAVKKTSTAQTTLQSQQPLPLSAEDQQQPPQPAGTVASSQSLPEQQNSLPSISTSLNSVTDSSTCSSDSQSEPPSAVSPVSNGGHLLKPSLTSSSANTSTSQSAANIKLTNAHQRTATLSQIVTNSYSQDLTSTGISFSSLVPSLAPSSQTSIAHKVGIKCSRDKNSHMTPPPESLVVQIPRNLVQVVSLTTDESHESSEVRELHDVDLEPSLPENDLSLIVKIDISLLLRGRQDFNSLLSCGDVDTRPNRTEVLENDRKHHPASNLMIPVNLQHKKRHKVTEYDEPMETETSLLFGKREIPFTGHHLVPSGVSPGVDGCLGNDGYWYAWTDTIPGHDEAVTVLPYIYIDDESNDGIDLQ